MTKQEEKDLLQALKKGSYFCETFGTKVIDKMCECIDDDMLLYECGIISQAQHDEVVNTYKEDIAQLQKAHEQNIKDERQAIAYKLLESNWCNSTIIDFAIQELGVSEVVRYKLDNNLLYFTTEETEYVKGKL